MKREEGGTVKEIEVVDEGKGLNVCLIPYFTLYLLFVTLIPSPSLIYLLLHLFHLLTSLTVKLPVNMIYFSSTSSLFPHIKISSSVPCYSLYSLYLFTPLFPNRFLLHFSVSLPSFLPSPFQYGALTFSRYLFVPLYLSPFPYYNGN